MPTLLPDHYIFDFEVTAYDWLLVLKHKSSGQRFHFHNDADAVRSFMQEYSPLLCGFNCKHYDQWILKAVLMGMLPYEVKAVNDFIIAEKREGWEYPGFQGAAVPRIRQYDLMDDMQEGLSLKAIEAHMGKDIRESSIDFTIDRPLTAEEVDEMFAYCDTDVDNTDMLDDLRADYLTTKVNLGREAGIAPEVALGLTNAKLTALFLKAEACKDRGDQRLYTPPKTIAWEWIPREATDFFNRLYDFGIPDWAIFGGYDENGKKHSGSKATLMLGDCPCTLGWGGIHAAIPTYTEEATEVRRIRNLDVASYYPHQMVLNGFCSRSMPNPSIYVDAMERRVAAKKAGDKVTANALKLVLDCVGVKYKKSVELYQRCELIAC